MLEQALKNAILSNLSERSPSLVFEIAPDRLINKDYCENLSNEVFSKLDWEVLTASPTTFERIPETSGLYMFVWKPYFKIKNNMGKFDLRYILYVGKADATTSNLKTRYKKEYSDYVKQQPDTIWSKSDIDNRDKRLRKYLNLWELEYWFCSITNSEDINKIDKFERDLIETLSPPINYQYKPKEIEVISIRTKVLSITEKAPF